MPAMLKEIVQAVRDLTRPVVTLGFASSFIYLTATKTIPADAFVATAAVVILWWFKSKSDEKQAAKKGGR